MLERIDARLLIVLGALIFSTGGAAVKAATLTSWQVAAFRSGIACIALLLLVPAVRRGWNWRLIPVGLTYAGTLTCFVLANKLTTAASAIYLQSTAPLYLLFLGPLLLREHIHPRDIWFMGALGFGLSLFFIAADPVSTTAPAPLTGNMLGALAGIFWAFTLLGMRWLAVRPGSGTPAASAMLGNLFAFFICIGFALPVEQSQPLDWWLMLYLGVIQIGLAYVLVTAAINRVTALEASLLILIEPVFNPVWAWLLLGEIPGALAITGGIIILAATVLRSIQQRRLAASVKRIAGKRGSPPG